MEIKTRSTTNKVNLDRTRYLKRFIFKSILVICILSLIFCLKKLNFKYTNTMLDVLKENIQYEFSFAHDGKKVLHMVKEFTEESLGKIAVFNPISKIDKYPSPIQGKVHRFYDKTTNKGLDIRAVDDDDPISIVNGTIKEIEISDKKGYYITIQNGDMDIIYGYLSRAYVSKGDSVSVGEPIGKLGTSADNHKYLRLEIWIDGVSVDPLDYIDINSMPQ